MYKRPESGTAQQPSLDALRTGAAMPTQEQLGHRVDLPDAMREKMENAFSADLSSVKLYESSAVQDAGAEAITQGSNIAFAPGLADFSGYKGQLRLGHEISHVVSQARGEVTGSGFLSDPALEARAQREGAMAASGQQIAMPADSLSPVSAAAASGPMQAGFKDRHKKKPDTEENPWKFTSSKKDREQLPANGVSFFIGPENESDTLRGPVFKEMRKGLSGLAAVRGNRDKLGGRSVYDAMMGNAYGNAIAGMEKYKRHLQAEIEVAEGRANPEVLYDAEPEIDPKADKQAAAEKLARDRAEGIKKLKQDYNNPEWRADRERQLALLDDYIASGKADQAANQQIQNVRLSEDDRNYNDKAGGINRLLGMSRGEAGALFKPSSAEAAHTKEEADTEHSVLDRVGIRYRDDEGNAVDPRTSNREIAFARLCGMLGSSVGIGAKHAVYDDSIEQKKGVLMEEAKGKKWYKLNWLYHGPDADMPSDPSKDDFNGGDAKKRKETWGDRMKRHNVGIRKKASRNLARYYGRDSDMELDAADPDFQRQMNEMFLVDTLASHTDRHAGNYKIHKDENGKIQVRAIDNDTTFGTKGSDDANRKFFGKRGKSFNYGGLPAQMQIDANMAKRIEAVTPEMLQGTFSDLLSKEEIDALKTRFDMMKNYINKMRKANLIVDQWNEKTAKKEMRLAGGVGSYLHENMDKKGKFAGNNYYQRQLLILRANESDSQNWVDMAGGATKKEQTDAEKGLPTYEKEDEELGANLDI